MLDVLCEDDRPGSPVNGKTEHAAHQVKDEIEVLLDQGSPGEHP